VAVTDAAVVLVAVPAWNGTGTYLVPAYRLTAADGTAPVVLALAEDALVLRPGATMPPSAPSTVAGVSTTVAGAAPTTPPVAPPATSPPPSMTIVTPSVPASPPG
jgi:hypothetical protein